LRKIIFIIFVLLSIKASSQKWDLGVLGGIGNYQGDVSRNLKFENSGLAFGAYARNNISPFIAYRIGLSYTKIAGYDNQYAENKWRNLSFHTPIIELSNIFEINFQNFSSDGRLTNKNKTFFAFTGINLFYFNPYTIYNKEKVYLQPLGTEGQNLLGKDNRYSRMSVSIPFGIGYKYKISSKMYISFEIGFRYSFSDYIDDVSGSYPDLNLLRAANGDLPANLSDRSIETEGKYKSEVGMDRGDVHLKDWYVISGFSLVFQIPNPVCKYPTRKFKLFLID